MSDKYHKKIRKEIARFKTLAGSSSESAVERAYIETLLELPWDKTSVDNESMKRAQEGALRAGAGQGAYS